MKPDIKNFKHCMAKFATGVTIVTTLTTENKKIGMTVNSFNSVSLDPFLVLFSLKKKAHFYSYYAASKNFTINILSIKQAYLSELFAKPLEENWQEVKIIDNDLITSSPAIEGSLAFLECESYAKYDGGDHTIFVGKVINLVENSKDDPLIYFASEYKTIDLQRTISLHMKNK